MKTLILLIFATVGLQAAPFLCVLKTKSGSIQVAPTLASPGFRLDGVLDHYLVQTMDKFNPMTVVGMDTRKLDYRKPYLLDFVAQVGARTSQFKIKFTKNTGLAVHIYNETTESFFTHEFLEFSSNPASILIQHRNGLSTSISCLPN